MRAADVMTTNICVVAPEAPIQEIAREMLDRRISGMPVVDGDGNVLGIVSEGDLVRRAELGTDRRSWWLDMVSSDRTLASDYVKTHGRTARDVMSSPAVVVEESTGLAEIAKLLESRRIKRVPVVRDGKLVGVVSRADIVRGLIVASKSWGRPRRVDDEKIRTAILAEIQRMPFASVAFINVVVDHGEVHVWGHVETPEQRSAIRVAAENVRGVGQVIDNMVEWRVPAYV